MPLTPDHRFSRRVSPALLLLVAALGTDADERGREPAPFIEVFTTSQYPIQENTARRAPYDTHGQYIRYDIDRISLLEQELSRGLPADPARAKQRVLQRFQSMDSTLSQQLEQAGKGLAQAMRYGIDRMPAVVFDGQAVIYGVTDIDEALVRYHRWREEADR